jgi:transcriptional regulator with XRE-family HTH domain
MTIVREPAFAQRVTAQRKKRGLSQTECANMLGIHRQQFNNWETGLSKPKGEWMRQLAAVLQCDPEWLQHGEEFEIQHRIENVMVLMRTVVRDLDHIHKALQNKKDRPDEEAAKS